MFAGSRVLSDKLKEHFGWKSTTVDVSHDEMSLLKEEAPPNMFSMVKTADVTHDPMSGLHVLLPVAEPPQ